MVYKKITIVKKKNLPEAMHEPGLCKIEEPTINDFQLKL